MKIKKNWYKIAQLEIPLVLYHATFRHNLESIKKEGLNPYLNGIVKCWPDCENGIYLHIDPDVAMSYAETTDNPNISEEWLDNIIVLEINTISLDKNLFVTDPNLVDPTTDSFLYRGIIPYSSVKNIL